jgi:hypothetical protein
MLIIKCSIRSSRTVTHLRLLLLYKSYCTELSLVISNYTSGAPGAPHTIGVTRT